MNNEKFHPVLAVPPATHALHHWDAQKGRLSYEYNGTQVLTVEVPPGAGAGFRHGSDGSMQSVQYIQQIYVSTEEPVEAVMTLCLSGGAVNMKPGRAGGNEAILGQLGAPLMKGVCGMYDPAWDLLVDWHGTDWEWMDAAPKEAESGRCTARLKVRLSRKALYINLRMRYYQKHLGYVYHEPWKHRMNPKTVSGWCSWEAFRRDVSLEKIEQAAAFAGRHFRPYGMEYIQVDDGYQQMPLPAKPDMTMAQGWLSCDAQKFPTGHEGMINTIRQNGMSPAIWTNANITNLDFAQQHPGDVIFRDGEPLKGEWIDYLYTCTPECLQKHVVPLFRTYAKLGYQYVKIDAIRHLLFDGLHECVRLGMLSDEEAQDKFRAYMAAVREGLGKNVYFLASWGEMHEVVGLADACRISMDANPTWPGIRMQLFESARWYHTHRVLFLNDPDHVCVRTKKEWAQSVLSLISLSGELYMLSDTMDAYTPEKQEIIRKTLPPLATMTGETGPLSLEYPAYTWTKLHGFAVQSHETPVEMEEASIEEALDVAGEFPTMDMDHPFSSLWAFHLRNVGRGWCVMARIATMPLRESRIGLEKLQLDADKTYLVFDFWKQRYLGKAKGAFQGEALPVGHCQIAAFYEESSEPQLIGSDRHVSMDAVSVTAHRFEGGTLFLTLQGVPEDTCRYTLHCPDAYRLLDAQAKGARVSVQAEQDICVLTVCFGAETAELAVSFEQNRGNEGGNAQHEN